jgi:ABC-type phosphate transport system substrate-binding protein
LRRTPLILLALIALVALAGLSPAAAADQDFRVIVHPEVEGTQIPRGVLSSIFLMEAPRWGNGLRVAPVDQSMKSEVRASFSQVVLETPLEGVSSLWHQKVTRGIMPPPVKSSDDDVIAYVAKTKGAIGYVSASAALPTTVKPVTIID